MNNLSTFFQNIDWIFLAVILIGGRYWGSKYFTISKNKSLNFLAFASVFAIIWLPINYQSWNLIVDHAPALFLTYLFGTSFYELIAKKLFEVIEGFFGKIQPAAAGMEVDYIQYPTFGDFPKTGSANTVYLAVDEDKDYVWDGVRSMYRVAGDRPPKPPRLP